MYHLLELCLPVRVHSETKVRQNIKYLTNLVKFRVNGQITVTWLNGPTNMCSSLAKSLESFYDLA